MSRRKKNAQYETFENADGFQVKELADDCAGEDVLDKMLLEDEQALWSDESGEDDLEDDEAEQDDYFDAVAENEDWEDGYDY